MCVVLGSISRSIDASIAWYKCPNAYVTPLLFVHRLLGGLQATHAALLCLATAPSKLAVEAPN